MSDRLAARGWVANHDGNVSIRLPEGRYLCTPTAVGKAEVTLELLVIVDGQGKLVSGKARPFSEMGLHLQVYRARPDVKAVIHAHPPTATGLAVAGSGLLAQPFLYEAVVSLGASIPTVPPAMPGKAAEEALRPFLEAHDVVLLGNHGVLAWGPDLINAFYRLELVEHLARIAMAASQAGGIRTLDPGVVAQLLEARRKAGLGPEARAAAAASAPKAATALAQAPGAASAKGGPAAAARPRAGGDLRQIISEELTRAIGRTSR
jgi:L-fuculose-phosphate aldolase